MKALWVILAVVSVWVALTLAINLPREYRLRQLARSRAGTDAFATLRQSLPDIPEQVLADIYREVQDLVAAAEFPLRADDDLRETLEIDQGSLEILIEELTGKYWLANDHSESVPINTFAELAKAVWPNKPPAAD